MLKYFGINRFFIFLKTIRQYGGIWQSTKKLFIMDSLRPGCHVGTDSNGNKYYENNYYFYGRNRWVEYAEIYNLNYDGSQVTPEWFGWLHYKTDLKPFEDPTRPCYKWMMTWPEENLTGTPGAFMPYSTTKQKIQVWQPPKVS